jgi:hypothetical protein
VALGRLATAVEPPPSRLTVAALTPTTPTQPRKNRRIGRFALLDTAGPLDQDIRSRALTYDE